MNDSNTNQEGLEKRNIANPETEAAAEEREFREPRYYSYDPSFLPTVTMRELYNNVYQSRPYLIDGYYSQSSQADVKNRETIVKT